jgi:hypothetical protein
MKRVELLEALYLQGKKMRELQVYYFSLRKGGGRFSSPEAKKVLAQSKLEELQYDKMVKELDEWWASASLSHQASDGTPPASLSHQASDGTPPASLSHQASDGTPPASLSHQDSDGTLDASLSDQDEDLSFYGDLPNGCTGNCGMGYCDENGCVERKRVYVNGLLPHNDDREVCNPVNDGDDDIRI